jgi:hypothetical protein
MSVAFNMNRTRIKAVRPAAVLTSSRTVDGDRLAELPGKLHWRPPAGPVRILASIAIHAHTRHLGGAKNEAASVRSSLGLRFLFAAVSINPSMTHQPFDEQRSIIDYLRTEPRRIEAPTNCGRFAPSLWATQAKTDASAGPRPTIASVPRRTPLHGPLRKPVLLP